MQENIAVTAFTNLSLRKKFALGLFAVFLVGIALSGVIFWRLMERRAEWEVTNRAQVLIETMSAVRRYTSTHVNPLLAPELATAEEFISETVPAFSAREVFENFRTNEQNADFFYKEATLNPTNPRDLADDFEAQVVEQFRSNAEVHEVSGFRTLDNELMFYTARPLAVSADTCLRCHSAPENAPPSLINTYGADGGFGWQLNEVVSAQMIYVPASEIFNEARQQFLIVMGVITAVFAIAIFYVAYMLRRNVASPVETMAGLAAKISADSVQEEDIDTPALKRVMGLGDELGQMARTFSQMAHNVAKREAKLKQELQELRIEIDHAKRQEQVEQITGTDYFQNLQAKARQARQSFGVDTNLEPGTSEG